MEDPKINPGVCCVEKQAEINDDGVEIGKFDLMKVLISFHSW